MRILGISLVVLLSLTMPAYGATLKDFFWRADRSEIKLTFKFDAPAKWKDVSPDQYRLALEMEGSQSGLPYAERPMTIGPLQRIIFTEKESKLTIWIELDRPTAYETYDEAGGRLVSIILKGPFESGPKKENLYSFDFYDTEVRDAIVALAKVAGVNVVVDDSVEGKITASFENLTFEQALGYILTMRGLGQVKLGNNIIIAKKEKLEESFGLLEVRRFPLKYIDPESAKEIVRMVLAQSVQDSTSTQNPEGGKNTVERVIADSSSKSIVVRGKAEDFEKVEAILKEIDVPMEVRTFYLSNNIYGGYEVSLEGLPSAGQAGETQDQAGGTQGLLGGMKTGVTDELEKIKEILKIVVPDEKIGDKTIERVKYFESQKAFVVRGTKEELDAVAQILSNLDRKLPQIMVDVKMLEINRQKMKNLGVSWTVGGQEGQITFGELSLGGTMERQDLVEMTIKALEQKQLARLVGNPRILTLSGKTAVIHVGDEVPYREGVEKTEEEGKTTVTSGVLKKVKVGITLVVTPVLTEEGTVVVRVTPEVSTYVIRSYYAAGLLFEDPQTKVKSADTTARLRPGETLVIGGLIRSEDIENITKIPILGDLPLIGQLFTLRNKTHTETELVIFLTPHLVEY